MHSHKLFRPLTVATLLWLSLTVQSTWAQNELTAAVLPTSRSVQVETPATAFATIINTAPGTATQCSIAPASFVPATFRYQTTDALTNELTGIGRHAGGYSAWRQPELRGRLHANGGVRSD